MHPFVWKIQEVSQKSQTKAEKGWDKEQAL